MSLIIKEGYTYSNEVGELFSEYTDYIKSLDKDFAVYLEVQHYDDELQNLELKYAKPDGRLYIAFIDDKPAGCIGLKRFDEDSGEMKRLYVRPDFRGENLGRKLSELIIKDAKDIGYKYLLLDTMPALESAVKLYKSLGFYEIPKYNDNPLDTFTYMKLDL